MSRLYDAWSEILKIQKFRRAVGKTIFFSFSALISYAYNSNTTRAGYSRGDQFYASYPAGSELLTDTTKLYKSALGNCFEVEEWGPIEWSVMAKHFERQGKSPYAYHAGYFCLHPFATTTTLLSPPPPTPLRPWPPPPPPPPTTTNTYLSLMDFSSLEDEADFAG